LQWKLQKPLFCTPRRYVVARDFDNCGNYVVIAEICKIAKFLIYIKVFPVFAILIKM